MMKKVMAFVFAGVRTQGLSVLTRSRSVAAVPFAGKFRMIDFTLSNCVNSELYDVALLAQHAPRSLIKHVSRGKPWDLDRRDGGIQILQPYERQEGRRWYQGTADALRQNLDELDNSGAEHVFVLSSEIAYKMDYSWMLSHYQECGARATIAVAPAVSHDASQFGFVHCTESGEILGHDTADSHSGSGDAFMGIYLFQADYLREVLADPGSHNLFLDCIRPRIGNENEVRAYRFHGEWLGVAGIADYLRSNHSLMDEPPALNLYDPDWRIYARSEERQPAWFSSDARVINSLISNGAVIEGDVSRSVLSPGVHVAPGAVVRDSVILNDARIESGAVVERTVLDKNTVVGRDATVGDIESTEITVVGERAMVPAGTVIPPGLEIQPRELTLDEYLNLSTEVAVD